MYQRSYAGSHSGGSSRPRSSGSFNRGPARSGGSSHSSYRGGSSSGRSFGSRGGGYRGGNRGGGAGRFRKFMDVSKFINKVTVTEEAVVFTPEHKFSDFHIDPKLKASIASRGYVHPTPIQDKIIPYILQGRDVVGMANTGTGKTAAFLIPLINQIIHKPNASVMIIAPTRELATQINDELRAFTKGMNIFSTVCVGGMSISNQIRFLQRKQHFVIGTPGRLKDLMERDHIRMENFQSIVLDEADRMLDMGFVHDMKFIIDQMPTARQGLFFSATLSREIEALIKDFLNEPMKISVKTQETAKNIEQDVIKVPREKRFEKLAELLSLEDFNKVLVFTETKHGAERLANELSKAGFASDSIHGNKRQSQRQRTLTSFKEHKIQVLVATDVAARGLDINDISHVINYDLPQSQEDYVHRIGRTGRGSKKGKALTFIQ